MKNGRSGANRDILLPLAIRAIESSRPNARIVDRKAQEAALSLQLNLKRFRRSAAYNRILTRTMLFDKAASMLLRECPDAVCINLGCQLDSRFHRLDNGQITWYDVASPEFLGLQRLVFGASSRNYAVPLNPDDIRTWAKSVPRSKPVIVISETALAYLNSSRIAFSLNLLACNFASGMLIMGVGNRRPGTVASDGEVVERNEKAIGLSELVSLDDRFALLRELGPEDLPQRHGLSKLADSSADHVAILAWGPAAKSPDSPE